MMLSKVATLATLFISCDVAAAEMPCKKNEPAGTCISRQEETPGRSLIQRGFREVLLEAEAREEDTVSLKEPAKDGLTRNPDGTYTKMLAGGPVHNYQDVHSTLAPSLLEQTGARMVWILMLPASYTDRDLETLCSNLSGAANCEARGHPSEGGIAFVNINATERDLRDT